MNLLNHKALIVFFPDNTTTTSNKMSPIIITIKRVEENVSSDAIKDVLKDLGCITQVELVRCLSMKGVVYNRAIVHLKHFYENAGTLKPRTLLQSGKSIKISNKTYVWQAQMLQKEVQEEVQEEVQKQEDDKRPYGVRRINNALCEQDVAQGFKDRRIVDWMKLPISMIALALPDHVIEPVTAPVTAPVVEPVKPAIKPLEQNKGMVARMVHAFRCVITDEIYRVNVQIIRDSMEASQDQCDEEEEATQGGIDYGIVPPCFKRNKRVVIM